MTPEARRVRPRLRRLAIVAFAVLIPVAAWSLWDYVEARRFARAVAAIEARDEPIRTLSRRNTYVDRPDNAARYYDAAGALLHREALGGSSGIYRALKYETEDRGTVIRRARMWLEQNREAEHLLDRGTDMEFLGFQPGSEYNYRMDRLFALGSLAAIRALERLDGQDADGAARAVIVQLRLRRAMRAVSRTRRMISGFELFPLSDIGTVLRARPSAAALESLQAAVLGYDQDGAIEESALHMRAWLVEDVWDPASDWYGRPAVRFGGDPLEPLRILLARPWLAHRANAEIRLMTDLAEAARRPWPNRLKPAGAGEPPRPSRGFSAHSVVSAVRHMHLGQVDVIGRLLALVRTASAAVAVQRFQLARGALPRTLDELIPEFIPAVPVDPYSGRHVIYKPSPDGFVIYSVGVNGDDDGGESLQPSARWGPPGGDKTRDARDLGVRVRPARGDKP